jgi:dUTP pyrophosphatase
MKHRLIVKYKKFNESKDVFIPQYKSEGASGVDLSSVETDFWIDPHETKIISTNLVVEIPEGYEIQVRTRSGRAATQGLIVLNSPGTIDSDYRGEVKVILHNISKNAHIIRKGDRIAQAVLMKVEKMEFYADELTETTRNDGGFGSTGIK